VSVHVLSGAWHESELEGSALLVLIALADEAGDDGVLLLSEEKIAAKTRLSVRQVRRHVRAATGIGELEVRKGTYQRRVFNIYRLPKWAKHEADYDRLPCKVLEPFTTGHARPADKMTGGHLGYPRPDMGVPHPVLDPVEVVGANAPPPGGEVSRETAEPLPPPAGYGWVGVLGKGSARRDYLWEFFDREVGEVTNPDERGRRNKALKSLRQSLYVWLDEMHPRGSGQIVNEEAVAALAVEELGRRVRRFRELYAGATLTEMAMANNWRTLAVNGGRPAVDPFACPDCRARSFNSTLELREHREEQHGVVA